MRPLRDQMAEGHQPEEGKGSIPLSWRGHSCLDSSRTVRRLAGRQAQGPVVVVVVGVSEGQGLLAKSLCGEPEAPHGVGDMGGNTVHSSPVQRLLGICPLVGLKGDTGGRQEGVDPRKVQFNSKG